MTPSWELEGVESALDGFRLGPVDLDLRSGDAVAVLGPSGAGKTTLLRTIAGFVPVRRGRILRDGVDLTDRPPEERGLGYVPQGLGLLPHRTAAENVRYPLEIAGRPDARRRTDELLERFHLTGASRRRPARLSGGEQQRVAIARALAADPQLIVWDEPWQGLDVLARDDLARLLLDLRAEATVPVLVVTHEPSLAFSIADRFLVLGRGAVRELCGAATLLDHPTDPFTARFVGYENVLGPDALARDGLRGVAAYLAQRQGAAGIAFPAVPVGGGPLGRGAFSGTVRSVRPDPAGPVVELSADGLFLRGRLRAEGGAAMPRAGMSVDFAIDPTSLRPLGPAPGGR